MAQARTKGRRLKRPSSKTPRQLKVASGTMSAIATTALLEEIIASAAAAPEGDLSSWLSRTMQTVMTHRPDLEQANQAANLVRTLISIDMMMHGGNGGGINHSGQ